MESWKKEQRRLGPIINLYNPPKQAISWEVDHHQSPKRGNGKKKKLDQKPNNYTTKPASFAQKQEVVEKKKLVLSGARHGAIGC